MSASQHELKKRIETIATMDVDNTFLIVAQVNANRINTARDFLFRRHTEEQTKDIIALIEILDNQIKQLLGL